MTSKNSNLNNKPFLLCPVGKDYLWGGTRLREEYGKKMEMTPLAESWECSTHPAGISSVASGEDKGRLLSDVLKEHPKYLGTHPRTEGELPIMVKLIDAKEDLSVQVHPQDDYAYAYENGSLGKSEMWYVLEATKDSRLIYGFYHDMDKETLRESLRNKTIEKYLRKVKIHQNDVFYVEAGTVHAIGAGSVLVEIQERSDITYRMYDYDRIDKNNRRRELNIEKALEVANLKGSSEPRQPMRILKYRRGYASEFLCRCKYFEVDRILINTDSCNMTAQFCTGSNSFNVLMCTQGSGQLVEVSEEEHVKAETSIQFYKGDCIFIPADSVKLALRGSAQLLKIGC